MYFQMYTPLFTDNFSLSVPVCRCLRMCDILWFYKWKKQTFTSKTSAIDLSIYNKLIGNYPSHCSSCIKLLQLDLNNIISPYKIQLALEKNKMWFAVRAVFRISFTFLPWKILQAMAVTWFSVTINRNSRNQRKKLQSKHNWRAWKAKCMTESL